MSTEDGLVMQLHVGSWRDHNQFLFETFGPDKGADIPVSCDFTCGLRSLLNFYGNDPRLSLILFTLDELLMDASLRHWRGIIPRSNWAHPGGSMIVSMVCAVTSTR